MNDMKKSLMFFVLLSLSVVGIKAQKVERYQSTQARVLEPKAEAYVKPLTVELRIDNSVRQTDVWHLTPQQVQAMGGNIEDIRSLGIYMSCQKHKCDVIVAATFNLQSEDVSKGYDLTVVGYPASFVNWKTASPEDYEWIRLEKTFTTNEREKVSAVVKK